MASKRKSSDSDPRGRDPRVESFGRRLRQLRQGFGWSQEHLAELADLDRSFVSGLERGEQVPSLISIHKLAHALGCPPADLVGD